MDMHHNITPSCKWLCMAQHTITFRVKLGTTYDYTLFILSLLFGAWILNDGKESQYFGDCYSSLIVYSVSVNMADMHFIVDCEAD